MEKPDITGCALRETGWIFDIYDCPSGGVLYWSEGMAMTWTEPMFMWQLLLWVGAVILTFWIMRMIWEGALWDSRLWFQAAVLLLGTPMVLLVTLWFMNAPYRLARHGLLLSHGESVGVTLAVWSMVMGWLFFKASQRKNGGG